MKDQDGEVHKQAGCTVICSDAITGHKGLPLVYEC